MRAGQGAVYLGRLARAVYRVVYGPWGSSPHGGPGVSTLISPYGLIGQITLNSPYGLFTNNGPNGLFTYHFSADFTSFKAQKRAF